MADLIRRGDWPRTMTPKTCRGCGLRIFVNENGSLYEDENRMQYHARDRCLEQQLRSAGRLAREPAV